MVTPKPTSYETLPLPSLPCRTRFVRVQSIAIWASAAVSPTAMRTFRLGAGAPVDFNGRVSTAAVSSGRKRAETRRLAAPGAPVIRSGYFGIAVDRPPVPKGCIICLPSCIALKCKEYRLSQAVRKLFKFPGYQAVGAGSCGRCRKMRQQRGTLIERQLTDVIAPEAQPHKP